MYPFPGIGNASYLGNGTYSRQPQQQPGMPPQAPQGGLLSPQGGIPYASFNSAPGSGMGQMQGIMQQFGNPSTFGGGQGMAAAGNPYALSSMMGGQYQGAMGGGFGSYNPYAQNSFGGMNSMMGGGYQGANSTWSGNAPMFSNPLDQQAFANSNFTNPSSPNYVNAAGAAARINAGLAAGNPYAQQFIQQNGGVNPYAQFAQSNGIQPQTAQAPINPIFGAAGGS